MPLAHGDFKVGEVDFAERAFVHDRVGGHASQLRVVGGKVLRAGGNAVCLNAADIARRHLAGKVRILGEILKVAAAERTAFDIQTRAEQNAHILRSGLCAEMLAELLAKRRIPGVRHRRGGGVAGGGQGAVQTELVARALLLADTVRPVRQGHVFDAETLYALGLPKIAPRKQMTLFF